MGRNLDVIGERSGGEGGTETLQLWGGVRNEKLRRMKLESGGERIAAGFCRLEVGAALKTFIFFNLNHNNKHTKDIKWGAILCIIPPTTRGQPERVFFG